MSDMRLLEKMIRARIELEGLVVKCRCSWSDDDTYMAPPCTCGASDVNAKISKARALLKVDG